MSRKFNSGMGAFTCDNTVEGGCCKIIRAGFDDIGILKWNYGKTVYHFCSEECLNKMKVFHYEIIIERMRNLFSPFYNWYAMKEEQNNNPDLKETYDKFIKDGELQMLINTLPIVNYLKFEYGEE